MGSCALTFAKHGSSTAFCWILHPYGPAVLWVPGRGRWQHKFDAPWKSQKMMMSKLCKRRRVFLCSPHFHGTNWRERWIWLPVGSKNSLLRILVVCFSCPSTFNFKTELAFHPFSPFTNFLSGASLSFEISHSKIRTDCKAKTPPGGNSWLSRKVNCVIESYWIILNPQWKKEKKVTPNWCILVNCL